MKHKAMFFALFGVFVFQLLSSVSQNTKAYEVCEEPCDVDEMEIQKGLEILVRQYGVQWTVENYGNCMILKNNQSIALFCDGVGCEYCRFG